MTDTLTTPDDLTTPGDPTAAIARLQARVRACRLCQDHGYLPLTQPITEGRPSDRILLIGQAPGHVSVERGRPFSGPAGRLLDSWLTRAGFPPGARKNITEKYYDAGHMFYIELQSLRQLKKDIAEFLKNARPTP